MLDYIIKNQLQYGFIQVSVVFFAIYFLSGIKDKISYFLGAGMISIGLVFLYLKINLLGTGLLWLFSIILTFKYLKKINSAILLSSFTVLLYILVSYLIGIITPLTRLSYTSSMEGIIIISSLLYLLIVLGLKQIGGIVLKKFHLSERLNWLVTCLTTITFLSYFVIITIERFAGEESSMGQANAVFIIGYGVITAIVSLVLLYSLQKEYVTKEKQKEMQYLKEYTDQLEKNYTEMRRFKHDYQNILLSIEEYIQEKDLVKLEEYFYTKIKQASTIVTEKNVNLTK